MIARTSLSRATNQWLRTTSRTPARSMASAAAVNPFHFETSDANGIKIASRDDGAPTTSLSLVIRAGSRYQPAPGIAHGLQQFSWKNTEQRSALRTVREIELLGGIYGSSLSHENIVLKAQFLRKDLPYFVESLGQILTSTRYQQFIFSEEVAVTMKAEVEKFEANPSLVALERALGVAFHKGIGHARYSAANKYVNTSSIEKYAQQVYNKSNIALVASGASHAELAKWTKELMGDVANGSKATSPETKYYGGETRVDSAKGNAFVIGFPGTAGSPNFKAEYKILAHLLGGQTAVKWNSGFSLLSRAVADLPGVSAVAKSAQFTDTGLLYITVTGPDASLEAAGKAVVKALHDVTQIGAEDIKKAVAQAKFDVLAEVEDRSVGLELVGQSLIANGTAPQAEAIVKASDGVSAETVQKIAKSLVEGRATFSAVGDLHVLPYAEDIGLKI